MLLGVLQGKEAKPRTVRHPFSCGNSVGRCLNLTGATADGRAERPLPSYRILGTSHATPEHPNLGRCCIEEQRKRDNGEMPRRHIARNPLFSGRRFDDEVVTLCVRWYLRFKLSYRDVAEIAWEMGILVAPSTILRWVVRYAEEFARRWCRFERPVGGSWRADETYIKVRGCWMYLYRAVDGKGKTVKSYLSRTRDIGAAKALFRKALKHHGEPRSITLDGF
jgi:DDE domain